MDANAYEKLVQDLERLADQATGSAQAVRSEPLRQVATIFARNISNLFGLADLPLFTMTATFSSVMTVAASADPSLRESLRTLIEGGRMATLLKPIVDWRKIVFRTLLEKEQSVESSVNQLIYLLVAHLWTSFEVLATDLWIATVNCHPDLLVQRISKRSENGQPSKQFRVEVLAKYDYNVKAHMGTLLARRFGFSEGINGIQAAYLTIFQKEHRAEIESLFKTEGLFRLEETRHLIVHRAGIVDERFNSHMKADFEIGSLLELTPSSAFDLASAAVRAGCALVSLCDNWLSKHDQQERRPDAP
ncbi:MAG: hypothetical protein HZB53_10735 [Chloroflexi bacterium]|nr:hypothetical protein [Chloroflexota bacterium]